jgi:hypothetical protein
MDVIRHTTSGFPDHDAAGLDCDIDCCRANF